LGGGEGEADVLLQKDDNEGVSMFVAQSRKKDPHFCRYAGGKGDEDYLKSSAGDQLFLNERDFAREKSILLALKETGGR